MTDKLKTLAGIDALFATSLDDLADLPSYETPPPGSYALLATADVKEVNGKDSVEFEFAVEELLEAKNPTDTCAVGTKFSMLFYLDNEFAVGRLKKILAPFSEHFQTKDIQKLIMDDITDVQITATIKNRADKNDPEKVYASVTNIVVG